MPAEMRRRQPISSPCTTPCGARSRAPRAGEGPATIEATITRFFGHFEGDPQHYRAKDEVTQLRVTHGLPEALPRAHGGRWRTARCAAELDAIDARVLAA